MKKLSTHEWELVNKALTEYIEKLEKQVFNCRMADYLDEDDKTFIYNTTRTVAAIKVTLEMLEDLQELSKAEEE